MNLCFVSHLYEWLNLFLRYVIVECEDQDTQQRDPKTHEMYLNVMRRFSQALLKVIIQCMDWHIQSMGPIWPITCFGMVYGHDWATDLIWSDELNIAFYF